ncbi:hypothetical protein NXY56_005838 [Leishmania guyanensis]
MPPNSLSQPQKPRHITASTHTLAARLTHNTVERVTVGNTPLHMLHLCDVQCVAPLFASCVSLTAMTIHLKYMASSTALELLLCAAATSPTLKHISVMGGVTLMEASAMASGIAAFTWDKRVGGQRVSFADATPESPLPRTVRRVPSAREGRHFASRGHGEREDACRRRCLNSDRSAAFSPYAGTPPPTHLRRQPCTNNERGALQPTSTSSRSTQSRLRAGAAMWPVPYAVSPVVALVSHRTSPALSPGFLRTPPHASLLSAHHIEGGICLTLELHRLSEATATLLLDGLRRAHRIISAEVRLCVATAEARHAGQRLAQEAKKVAAHHRQRRLLLMTPPTPKSCLLQARAKEQNVSAFHRRSPYTSGLRVSPRAGLCTPSSPPQRPLASLWPATPVEPDAGCNGHGRRRTLLSVEALGSRQRTARRHEQRLTPRSAAAGGIFPREDSGTPVQPHTPLTPLPSSMAGGGATMRAQRPVLSANERVTVQPSQPDALRRRGRHASPPPVRVCANTLSRPVSPNGHLKQVGRLYSPPRWASRAQPLTNGPAPPPRPLSKVALCPTPQSASTRNTLSPTGWRLKHHASSSSSWSSWSSRSSSPLPRPPQPSPRRATESFAHLVVRKQATPDEEGEHAKRLAQRAPPDAVSAFLNRRGLCRLSPFSARQPHSPPSYSNLLCSPRYCLRRGSDGLGDEAGQRGIPPPQTPPHSFSSRCSCFVCHSQLPRSPGTNTRQAPRPATPANLEDAILALAASVARAPRPRSSPPFPCSPPSAPSSLASPPPPPAVVAAACSSRRPHKHDTISAREGRGAGDVTPTTHSAATSVNGITPPRRQSGGERENDNATAFHKAAISASLSSSRTSRSIHTATDSVHRSLNMDLGEGDHAGVRHSSACGRMEPAVTRCEGSHLQVSHTQLPSSLPLQTPEHQQQQHGEEVGYVVYPNSVAFLRARVKEINRHVVWHQIQSAKAVEAHSRHLAELEVTFSDRVTEGLTDILMVLTDMEHGSRIDGRR